MYVCMHTCIRIHDICTCSKSVKLRVLLLVEGMLHGYIDILHMSFLQK